MASSLKATFKSSYRKNQRLVCVYTVTGTAKDIERYALAKSAATSIAVDALVKDEKGLHLFHFVPNAAMGMTADKVFRLDITTNNRVVIDNGEQQMTVINEDSAAIRAARNARTGQVQADIALGLITATGKPIAASTTSTPTQLKNDDVVEPKKDATDTAIEDVQNLGNENLNDTKVETPAEELQS